MSSTTSGEVSVFVQQPLPWQDDQWRAVLRRLRTGTLPHALLLKGSAGIGKVLFAQALMSRVLCDRPTGGAACGVCKSCELLKAGTHPDVLLVQPESAGKPIKIDQIRRINEFARKTAQQGGRRVIVLNPAEAMNVNAANALLKSLEEPGADTLFLLVSARAGDMLATIRSRCQTVMFPLPDATQATQWLAEHIADQELIGQLLTLACGSPVHAWELFDRKVLEARGHLINAMSELFRGQLTPVELAKEQHTADLIELLGWLGSWLDDAVKLKLAADDCLVRNRDLSRMIGYLAEKADAATLLKVRDGIMLRRQQIQEGANLNGQMLLEGVFSDYLELAI